MYGTLRFFLAILVALSHLGVSLPNFNQGVFAVIIFYMLAGMVSYKLITNVYLKTPFAYYKDRFKRIYPLYFLSLLLAIVLYFIGINSYFVSKPPSYIDWISNFTIFPLAYYMYSDIDRFTLIPPVWSLAVELQFYLFAPFIFTSKRFFYILYIFSLFIFTLAIIGVLNTDYFGYRLLIGVIFIFLLGSLLYKAKSNDKKALQILCLTYILVFCLGAYIFTFSLKQPYNYEVISSLLIGMPIIYFYSSTITKNIDDYLGQISYGLFLFHFPALWLSAIFGYSHIVIVLFLTLLLSISCYELIKKLF